MGGQKYEKPLPEVPELEPIPESPLPVPESPVVIEENGI